MPRRPAVPVVVLSGGLGSGKTTMLNHLLTASAARIGVVVNDFGDIDVDAMLVTGNVGATRTFSGGCLCCLSDPSQLDDALTALARPSVDLDTVVIEASGLAEPRELARMVLSGRAVGTRFGGVVEVVDAATWATDADGGFDPSPLAPDHLAVASLVVVNKVDRIENDAGAHDRLTDALRTHAPGTPVVRTRFGVLDPALLFDVAERGEPTGQLSFADLLRADAHGHGHDGEHRHAHDRYLSVSVDTDRPADPRRLVAFLEGRAPGVYRVKGRVWVDADGAEEYVVQAVGGWVAFERVASRNRGRERRTQLVAIGTEVDAEEVRAALESCLTDPGVTPPDHLHAITRYTR